jgi:hypothetical protein
VLIQASRYQPVIHSGSARKPSISGPESPHLTHLELGPEDIHTLSARVAPDRNQTTTIRPEKNKQLKRNRESSEFYRWQVIMMLAFAQLHQGRDFYLGCLEDGPVLAGSASMD